MILTKLRLVLIFLLTSLILLTISGPAFAQPPMHRVIIVFSKTPTFTQQEGPRAVKEIRGFGGKIKRQYRLIPAMSAEVPRQALRRIRRLPGVAFIEEDQQVFAVDAELDNAWGVKRIGAGTVHSYNKGAGIKVAIIDTGINYNHPDLAANYAGGYDFYNNDNDPWDDHNRSHGTHVSGIVAARDNGTGVVGVAPEVRLYGVKVLSARGSGYLSDVIAGIQWAVENGMDVINMSLGTRNPSYSLKEACDIAYEAGIVVVAAAGNSGYGSDSVIYPAHDQSVIAVAATDSSDTRASFSSTGPTVELAAPGVNILSTYSGDNYYTMSGTSMATPHVVGLAALIIASGIEDDNGNGRINDEVRERMQQTAIDLGTPGRDNEYGYGLINATAAVPLTNEPPVAEAQSVGTPEDTPLAITLTGTDPDDDPLTYTMDTPPSNGTLTGTAPYLTYAPDPDYFGSDSFTFTVNDGKSTSEPATVSITVTGVNDPPVAEAQNVITEENTAVGITLTGTDPDNYPLIYTVMNTTSNGTLTGTAPDLTYTPDTGYFGSDNFTFTVSDGESTSGEAMVSITVTDVNYPPVAQAQSVETPEDTPLAITLTGTDPEGGTLSYTVVNTTSNGTLSGTAHDLTYTPDPDYFGSDNFTFTVSDSEFTSGEAMVSITVTEVNDPPVADPQNVTTEENTLLVITLTGTDPDNYPLIYNVFDTTSNGALTGTAPDLTYTPDTDYLGSDNFTFTVSDGEFTSGEAMVSITVTEVNDPPVAQAQSVETPEDTPLAITLTGTDPEGEPLSYIVLTPPSDGTLSGTAPGLTYTPDTDYFGSDSFTFVVNDGQSSSEPATVSITVTEVNDPPVAEAQSVGTPEDTPLAITLTGTDPDDYPLIYTVMNTTSNGTLTGTAPDLTYTPDAEYSGSDNFTFTVSDSEFTSGEAMVSITVTEVNDPPVAEAQLVETPEDTPLAITLAGTDPDDYPLIYTVVTPPSNGTLSGTAPDLTYTPDAEYSGSDNFTFTVNDGESTSEPATVSITVTEVNDPPVADPQNVTTEEDTDVDINLSGSDADGDTLTYEIVDDPLHGTLSGDAPNINYDPEADYIGSDNFTFRVWDGLVYSDKAMVSITVNPLSTPTIRVYIADIFIVQIRRGWRTCAKAIISAVDNNEEPIENMRITAHWEGATTDTESGYTAADGTITFTSSYRRYPSSGTEYIIVIDTITLPTGYELADDSVLTGTVVVP